MEMIKDKTKATFDGELKKAGYAQCLFIVLQVLLFPATGLLGTVIVAQCAMMPWLIPLARKSMSTAVAMSLTSLLMAPLFGYMVQVGATFLKGLLGG